MNKYVSRVGHINYFYDEVYPSGCVCFRWYPGCKFVQEKKGKQFIKNVRASMTAEEKEAATTIQYNTAGTAFLHSNITFLGMRNEKHAYYTVQTYLYCLSLL